MKTPFVVLLGLLLAGAGAAASAAEVTLEGNHLVVTGMLDGSAMKAFTDHLASGKVRTVVFENSLGGTAEVAGDYARAIQATGVNTEARGQCYAACAYAFLAGKEHRFGRGFQINGLLIPVGTRPQPGELTNRWRGDGAQKTLAEFITAPADGPQPTAAAVAAVPASAPKERWQPDHGVLFTSTPTLFGRVYNSFYCDGTQGRDMSRCEVLSDADPYKLGVLSP
ncbi:hypothetical protein SRS16CHR_04699 [Variovorax sp. SRS16]|uniref:hypothetical protein n=1 Tax=Variovorax sp. SRS16 TaxID=282217 RepID=UPI0013177431|nr:hypothetical protein [Variovorax sp. SRS16]VTU30546.1 hypothetical protein SRS16CHR_04699 [Variovorax sp. SRS16]